MSVDIESNIVVYTFASSRTFTYVFRLLSEADLTVTRTTAAGVSTVLALTTNYSVTGVNSYYGGTVVITAGTTLVAGDKITIQRTIASYTQGVAFRNQGAYYAETVEAALDKLTMMCLEIKSNASRQPSYVLTTEATNYAFPAPVLGQSFRWAKTAVYPITWYLEGYAPTLSTLAGQITTAQLPSLIPAGNLPALSAHSGSITTAQLPSLIPAGNIPALSALSGAVSASQLPALPASTLTGTVPAAALPAFTGDATTTAGSSAVTVGKIQGKSVSSIAPGTGDILIWNGAAWTPGANLGAGGGTGTLAGDVTGSLNSTVTSKLKGVTISGTAPQHQQSLLYNEPANQWEPSSYLTGMLNGNSNGSINIGEGALALETPNVPAAFASQTNTYSGVPYTIDSSTTLSLTAFSGIVYQSAAGGLALNVSSTSGSTTLVASHALPATLRVGQRVTHSGWTGNRYITGISGLNITIASPASTAASAALTAFDDLSATDTIITTGSIDITASGLAKTSVLNYPTGGTVNTHTFQVEGLTPGSTGTITLTSLNNNNIAIGHNAGNIFTSGNHNVIVGHLADSSASDATRSVCIGALSVSSDSSVTIGYSASSSANAISIGSSTSTSIGSVAIGYTASALYSNGIAIGNTAAADTYGSVVIGGSARTTAFNGTAIGEGAKGQSTNVVAVGTSSLASGLSSIAIGASAQATAASSMAIGASAQASGASSMVIGTGSTSAKDGSLVVGVSATIGSGGTSAMAIGNISFSNGLNSITIGASSSAQGGQQIVIGSGATIKMSDQIVIAEAYTRDAITVGGSQVYIQVEAGDLFGSDSLLGMTVTATGINATVQATGTTADYSVNKIYLTFWPAATASVAAGTKLVFSTPISHTHSCTLVVGSPVIYVANPGAPFTDPIAGSLVTGTGIPVGTKLVKTFHSEPSRGGTNRYFLLSRPVTVAGAAVSCTFVQPLYRYTKIVSSIAANSTILIVPDITNLKIGDKLTGLAETAVTGNVAPYLRGAFIVGFIGTTQIVLSQATSVALSGTAYAMFAPSGGIAIGNGAAPFSNELALGGHSHPIALTNANAVTQAGQSLPVTIGGRDYSIPLYLR